MKTFTIIFSNYTGNLFAGALPTTWNDRAFPGAKKPRKI